MRFEVFAYNNLFPRRIGWDYVVHSHFARIISVSIAWHKEIIPLMRLLSYNCWERTMDATENTIWFYQRDVRLNITEVLIIKAFENFYLRFLSHTLMEFYFTKGKGNREPLLWFMISTFISKSSVIRVAVNIFGVSVQLLDISINLLVFP